MKLLAAEARRRALVRVLKFPTKPTLVGHVALELDCSLAEAERELNGLVAEGLIRPVTPREMQEHDIRGGYLPV